MLSGAFPSAGEQDPRVLQKGHGTRYDSQASWRQVDSPTGLAGLIWAGPRLAGLNGAIILKRLARALGVPVTELLE
ncbi:MAG: hypothetical protein DME01_06135 [Candidatus Rokuibacteriota bacterium]|nr:MAG: hypothetical protein DME01_06135 [Candidatus Rokubacteria bacterium]